MEESKQKRTRQLDSIIDFFAGRSVFLTGGTGFLGKAVIEKLLRSCPDIREIFLLIRPKNGATTEERLRKLMNSPVFEKVRAERPSCFEKLIPVAGDASEEGLGLTETDRRVIIERTSVIFHVAANVRFEEDLRKDIYANTRSTRDICLLARSMKNLLVLMHVSSTYAHAEKLVVEENIYPPLADWRKTLQVVDTLDDRSLRTLTNKYIGDMPNTYTFSKRLAEQVVIDYSKELPIVLFRPSIVISSLEEPMPGWVDNFNGPVGLMIGGGKGILRVICIDDSTVEDYVPVDMVAKAMIVTCWKRGIRTLTEDPEIHVYNCTSNNIRHIVMEDLITMALKINETLPLEYTIWRPGVIMTKNRWLYYVLTLLLHLLPALLIDGILKICGKKPMIFRLQRTIYTSNVQLRYFLNNTWTFANEKMQLIMREGVPPNERHVFSFNYTNINLEEYFKSCLVGAKKYLLHEDLGRIEELKRHSQRLKWIDRIFRVAFYILAVWIVVRTESFSDFLRLVRSTMDGSILEA